MPWSLAPLRPLFRRLDPALYTIWAAGCTLASGRKFYGYMMKQTGGEWSAPLDDVFIHFDYARSTALGHPFEWVAGNGYSSGNTSLLYPFVLAAGYRLGFTDQRLMLWAAIVAAACVFSVLRNARGLFFWGGGSGLRGRVASSSDAAATAAGQNDWARMASYLLPPMVLGVGALDWSLWSGMEVALFLFTWGGALRAFLDHVETSREGARPKPWALGAWGVAIVLTRPEGLTTVLAFAFLLAWHERDHEGRSWFARAVAIVVPAAGPSFAVLVAQALANQRLTGELSANGAIVKLAVNNPFFTRDDKIADYLFNLKYAVLRNFEYHFADKPAYGVILPAFALAALTMRRTRAAAVLLWIQMAGWLTMVAFNGQVRWQNERYTMPAVAWLLVAAALGAFGLCRRGRAPALLATAGMAALALQTVGVVTRPEGTDPSFRFAWWLAIAFGLGVAMALRAWPVRAAAAWTALVVAFVHQEPRMRDQKWFFGRASRNIRDQHVVAGRWLFEHEPGRVLVGDAGALMYASHRPGLDIIGLGGFHELPFARAGLHGLPATIELIERMKPAERPDVVAIYPSWWGVLSSWFVTRELARFPAEGNVICGGYEDVIYRADWSLLNSGDAPRTLAAGDEVRDQVDVADLVSEREHRYLLPVRIAGWTEMKILADPIEPSRDLWDGGRRIGPGQREVFHVTHLTPGKPARLVLRSAPESTTDIAVRAPTTGKSLGRLHWEHTDGWVEQSVQWTPEAEDADIDILNEGAGDFIDYHAWVAQPVERPLTSEKRP